MEETKETKVRTRLTKTFCADIVLCELWWGAQGIKTIDGWRLY